MHGRKPDGDSTKTPFNDFDTDLNAKPLISNTPRSSEARFLKRIELKPTEQQRIPLGSYTDSAPPKGFSVEVTPDPHPEGSVLTEITSLGTTKSYKLTLHVTNYGTRIVSAEVWQL